MLVLSRLRDESVMIGQDVEVKVVKDDGNEFAFTARCRIDTFNELEYFRSGGILHYVLRRLAAA